MPGWCGCGGVCDGTVEKKLNFSKRQIILEAGYEPEKITQSSPGNKASLAFIFYIYPIRFIFYHQ